MLNALNHLVTGYGLPAILVLMAAESCGVPIPSELVVPLGGVLAAERRWSVLEVALVASVANVIGSLAAYAVAARWGIAALLGPGRYIGIRRHHVELADHWFGRFGLIAVFIGRMLPVVRTYISFPAGLAGVPLGRFVMLTFVGALPWNLGLAYLGYSLGTHYDRVTAFIQQGGYLVAILLLGILVLWWWRGRQQRDGDGLT